MSKIASTDRKNRAGFSRWPVLWKGISTKVKASLSGISQSIVSANNKFQKFINKAVQGANRLKSKINPLKGEIAAVFSIATLIVFGNGIVSTIAKFERFEAVLENTLGSSSAASTVLNDITEFASRTPFQVDELTDSWVRMANQGFTLNMAQLTKMGDLASSTGKGFTQLAEAALDASVNEFERLKEFGIKASSQGDKVKFTFKGVTTEIGKNAAEINKYLLGLGEQKGVKGAMAKISQTIGGMISNLKDRYTLLQKNLGEQFRSTIVLIIGYASTFIDKIQETADWVDKNRELTKRWAARIGLVAASLVALYAAARMFIILNAVIKGTVFVFGILRKAIVLAKYAQIAFNFVANLSPFGWISLVITGIVLLLMNFKKVRQFLWNLTKFFLKVHPFAFLIDLMDRVFPGFKKSMGSMFSWVIDSFKKAYNWLKEKIFKPIGSFFSWLWGEATKDIEVNDGEPVKFKTENEGPEIDPYSMGFASKGGKSGGGKTVSDRIKTVSSGVSSSIKHINISIGSLVEQMQFTTPDMQMSKELIKAEVTRVLIGAVNDVNHM